MAQYQHLPIYKQTYDILLRTMTATKDFPREYKYTLGQKIKDELIELVVMIYRANSATDKAQHIESIVERVQAIQLMMRLSHDMKILTPPRALRRDSIKKRSRNWLDGRSPLKDLIFSFPLETGYIPHCGRQGSSINGQEATGSGFAATGEILIGRP